MIGHEVFDVKNQRLKDRKDKTSRQIVFEGERLDMQAVWKLRNRYCPPRRGVAR